MSKIEQQSMFLRPDITTKLEDIQRSVEIVSDRVDTIILPSSRIILTNKELCAQLKVCSRTAQKWRDNGLITYSKIGREIFYKYSDVLHMIESHETKSIKQ